MRLFVALNIPEDVRETLARLITELKSVDNSWKWTQAENLHITLKFLGEIPRENLDLVCNALRGVSCEWPIPVNFEGMGFFPNERRPRVLWIGLDAPPALAKLAAEIEGVLASAGAPREERAFTPHLTLARNKDGKLSEKMRTALATHFCAQFGAMNATSFQLIESKLKSTGAEYTTLESFSGKSQN